MSGKQIEQYDHKGKTRVNNPPVGLVTPDTDKDAAKKNYAYDPHIDPALQFDSQRSVVESLIIKGLEAGNLEEAREALTELQKMQDPYLNWAGKAEHTSFDVPTVSLHVHERIDPRTIIDSVRKREEELSPQPSLFDEVEENPPLREAIQFYKHSHNWSNRMVAGDSLLVMNSLLEKEGLAGRIQMIFMDPPYGIKYDSNFQPFVNKRIVKDGKDEDLTSEPEMLKAFRDTWELGIHSYLTYIKDRLLLARELLSETGSIFIQISDENIHHLRELLDEVFGSNNFCALIPFRKKTMPMGTTLLEQMNDFLLWYAKDKSNVRYHTLFKPKITEGDANWRFYELPNGSRRQMTKDQIKNYALLNSEVSVYRLKSLEPSGPMDSGKFTFQYSGHNYPSPKNGWGTGLEGMNRLKMSHRLEPMGTYLQYILYRSDFPVTTMTNPWNDTSWSGFGETKVYVVQTNTEIIKRCILMTTEPGDIVLDPTCGSGTTAYVAEQWGRRWITCDTSRVAVTLAKQRLMTAVYDYYELARPGEGVGSGFRYKTVPHITLKSIANNEEINKIYDRCHPAIEKALNSLNKALNEEWQEWEVSNEVGPDWKKPAIEAWEMFWELKRNMQQEMDATIQRHAPQETLYDQPFIDHSKARVSGPFTVEAVPAPVVKPLLEVSNVDEESIDRSVVRSGETLRQTEWREELLKTGIRGKNGQYIMFSRVEPLSGTRYLHAEAETRPNDWGADEVNESVGSYSQVQRTVISFGPEFAPLEQRQVALAIEEAQKLVPKPSLIIFAAFQIDPEAAKDIDELEWPGVTLLKAQMNPDLFTSDLKKKRASNDSYWLIGQPDVQVEKLNSKADKGKYQVEVLGFDYYNTKKGTIESGGSERIAMWMLDTDYDGRSLYPRQVFFPMAGSNEGWAKLARNLKAEIDPELMESYRGTVSLPFATGPNRRIAIKIIDDRGIESLKIMEVD